MYIEESIIVTYKSLVKGIARILEMNGIKHHVIYTGIGMSRSTWERRIKGNDFTVAEMEKIAVIVNKIYKEGMTRMEERRKKTDASNLNK